MHPAFLTSLPIGENLSCDASLNASRRKVFVGRAISVYLDGEQAPEPPQSKFLPAGEDIDHHVGWRRPDGSWQQRPLLRTQVCIIPRQTLHFCGWSQAPEMIVIYVDPESFQLATPTDVSMYDLGSLLIEGITAQKLVAVLRKLCRQPDTFDPLVVESVATALAERLLRVHLRGGVVITKSAARLSPSQLEEILSYIGRNLGGGISIASLAREAAVCPRHFTRLFKQSTGLSPQRYILKCRLLRAKELLSTREFCIADTAYETGFCDQSHLNRHFKKFFGVTPAAVLRRAELQ